MVAYRLKGIGQFHRPTLSANLSAGLISFFDWGFTNVGAYHNVSISESGIYGGDRSRLRPAQTGYHTNGRVWEGYRGNWVWQSGIAQSTQPVDISGVFINSAFVPVGTGVKIDYVNGRVIFPYAVPTTSVVRCEYSYKHVNVKDIEDVPTFQRLQTRSYRLDDPHFLYAASGNWYPDPKTRIQLPLIGVEVVNNRKYEGYQLGGGQKAQTDVIFHIFSENKYEANSLADQISYQNHKTIFLLDLRRLANDNAFPLKIDGSKNSNPLSYIDLVKPTGDGGYRWNKCYMYNAEIQNGQWVSPHLYNTRVRMSTEVILTNI